ncbi:hypothetical protein IscW_ISCW017756 [Ixodes scapularis]|uniref:Uncharacterized protein n=1 Tax=Ixodes scapularis TaxID=6945 RepID=B7PEN6_IXOSC|nr:hypothetical protein IscW_ISCW017756 [Ixodes scapularis]|eukprot:XP_002433658.1 hypothetical protein IscW_ISCW017756 [Ixodes scapularis]
MSTCPHIQMPIVSGRTVGPIPNPLVFPISWFMRKDLPEWNFPTTAMVATGPSILDTTCEEDPTRSMNRIVEDPP